MTVTHRLLEPGRPSQVTPGLCALAIMTKAPRAGTVKTRLQPPLTGEEAAALNICFLRDTAAALHGASFAEERRCAQGVGVYTPAGAEGDYAGILPPDFLLLPQRGDDFGERLTHAVEDLFSVGFASVCLIDSDSPTVPVAAYREAVTVLRSGDPAEVVLGPSDDGGYYLVGMSRSSPGLFQGIDWSTESVTAQTVQRAAALSLRVHRLPTWFDVDDHSTLRRLIDDFACSENAGFPAPETRRFLERLPALGLRARPA